VKVVEGSYDPVVLEKRVAAFWEKNKAFRMVVESRRGGRIWAFLEGPPTMNGFMHVGHARGRTMKDVVLRFKTMQGYDVWRNGGWDCQGLPVELEVEKKLGTRTKKEIEEKIGLERFVRECKALVDYYLAHWREASEKLGLWLDYDNAYETRRDRYIEFGWWTLQRADERGLLVEDFKVVPVCPRCETSLSGHEVAQGYARVKDPSIYVKLRLVEGENEFIVVWTTTPWTIPGDEAVTVHPSYEYARVKVGGETWIVAKQLVDKVMKELSLTAYSVVDVVKGKDLAGRKYVHPLLDEVPSHKEHLGRFDHTVICGEHVTLEEGTGCVHTAPAHGPDDFAVGKELGLPIFCPVDMSGHFTESGGKYTGQFVKEADPLILEDLKRKGLLLRSGEIEHEYPLCWRCDSPLLYLADRQWFLRVGPIRDTLLSENQKVRWAPDWAGSARFGDWLRNADDWCISRSRIWGSPLNVWRCEKCGAKKTVGTIRELRSLAKSMPEHFELHRPWVDMVVLKCQGCGGDMRRVEFVLDCWFDSGIAHAAQVDYLSDRRPLRKLYPYDFITEAVDQTRGWFYSLIFTGVVDFDKRPYNNVLCQGHVLDKFNEKMSKSRGNVVWAMDAMDRVGTDPFRMYMLWKASPWDPLAFDYDELGQITRWLTILWNVFGFATTYMDLDGFDPKRWSTDGLTDHLRVEDRWILARTQSLIKSVTEGLESYSLHAPVRLIMDFIVDDLSRLYVRLARKRTWVEKDDPDKLAAYATLYRVLSTLLKLLAPFAPYIAEELYQSFVRSVDSEATESVHACDWPRVERRLADERLEAEMKIMQGLVSSVLYARQKSQVKLRWPVRALWVVPSNAEVAEAVSRLRSVLLDQANSKTVETLERGVYPEGVEVSLEPEYSVLGPRLRGRVPEVAATLRLVGWKEAKRRLREEGGLRVTLQDGSAVELRPNEILFKETLPSNLSMVESEHGRVYVDLTRTPELLAESLAKEVVRRVQTMRKEMNLRIEEFVDVVLKVQEDESLELLKPLEAYVKSEVRARSLVLLGPNEEHRYPSEAHVKAWDVDGETVEIAVKRRTK